LAQAIFVPGNAPKMQLLAPAMKSHIILVSAASTLLCAAHGHAAFSPVSFRQPPPPPTETPPTPPPQPEPTMEVSYAANGQDWTAGVCKSRDLQSPINFDDHILDPPMGQFFYDYRELNNATLELTAADSTLHVWFPQNDEYAVPGGLTFRGKYYPLTRMDFKVKGEHLFRGVRLPMEIQLVHRSMHNPQQFVILAVRVWCETMPPAPPAEKPEKYYPPDPAEMDFNKQIQHFLMEEPPDAHDKVQKIKLTEKEPLDLKVFAEHPLITDTNTYIEYAGSLTAPPCLETVTWLVRRSKMLASNGQVKAFSDAIMRMTKNKGNFRSAMPFGDRTLNVLKAVPGVGPLGEAALMPLGPNPRNDKEFQVAGYVDVALGKADQAKRYFRDFTKRAQAAAKAHSDMLTKPFNIKGQGKKKKDQWAIATEMTRDAIYGSAKHVQDAVTAAIDQQALNIEHMAAEAAQVASAMPSKMAPSPGAAPGPAPAPAPEPGAAPGPGSSPGPGAAPGGPGPAPGPAPAAR